MNSQLNKIEFKIFVPESRRAKFEYLTDKFLTVIKTLQLSSAEYDQYSKNLVFKITIENKSNYFFVIETLSLNGFRITSPNPLVSEIIKNIRAKYKEDVSDYAESLRNEKKVNFSLQTLDSYIREGNYIELIKVTKNIRLAPEVIAKSKTNITIAVNNAILRTIEKTKNYIYTLEEALKILLHIASESELRKYNCDDLIKQAGLVAIDLCLKKKDSLHFLIKICNTRGLDYFINIKSAIVFSEEVFLDLENNQININRAIRELNTRWLYSMFDTVKNILSEYEIETFDKLMVFLDKERSK